MCNVKQDFSCDTVECRVLNSAGFIHIYVYIWSKISIKSKVDFCVLLIIHQSYILISSHCGETKHLDIIKCKNYFFFICLSLLLLFECHYSFEPFTTPQSGRTPFLITCKNFLYFFTKGKNTKIKTHKMPALNYIYIISLSRLGGSL